jgi:hypothetical protein
MNFASYIGTYRMDAYKKKLDDISKKLFEIKLLNVKQHERNDT